MAPVQSRQVVVWLVPSLAILLSFLWYRRKKNGPQSDPGEVRSIPSLEILSPVECTKETGKTEDIAAAKKMNRTLLGAESSPIDIILPHELKAGRTPPSIISDSDLDYEIEKMKSKKKSPIVKSLSKNKVNSVLSLQLQQVKSLSSVSKSPNKVFESPKDIEYKNSVNEERSMQNDTDIAQNGIVAAKNCIDKVQNDESATQNDESATQNDCNAVEDSRSNSLWVDIIDNSNEAEEANEAIEGENESNVEETKNELAAAKTDTNENCKIDTKTPQVETMETFVQRVCDKLEVAPKKGKKTKKGKNKNRNNNNIVIKTGATSFLCEAPKTVSKYTPKSVNKSGNGGKNVKARESMAVHRRLECDSANSSPECCITASSSLHSISAHSVDSNDSGKGGSDMVTTRGEDSIIDEAVNDMPPTEIIYEFDIPQNIVGLLIGKRGAFVNHIKSKSKTKIIVKEHPFNQDLRICSIEGLTSDVHVALNIIREKFPTSRFADLTLEQVNFMPALPTCTILNSGLPLVESINNDTKVSYVVSPVQMFLYQPNHPSYPRVQNIILRMTELYNNHVTPLVPTPIKEWSIVAAPLDSSWQRAVVLSSDEESDTTLIRYMDIGGYANVENTSLRQLRPEFTCWPFQATEVFLANLEPIEDQTPEKIEHAFQMIDTLTGNYFLQTQIVSYTEDDIPVVFIYVIMEQKNIIFLNREIAAQGLATWVDKYKVTC